MIAMAEKISWQAPEYIHREKTSDWYWIVGIVTISIALISIILNNVIFGILIVACSFTLSLFASRKPQLITMQVTGLGVDVGKAHHPYDTLESFWIETREVHPRILLKSKKAFTSFIVILLGNGSSEEIHAKLLEHLPEEEHSEPLLEKLLIYLGF